MTGELADPCKTRNKHVQRVSCFSVSPISSDAAATDHKATPPPPMKNARRAAAGHKTTQRRRRPPVRRRTALRCQQLPSEKTCIL